MGAGDHESPDLDKLRRQVDAAQRYAITRRPSDALEARGEDPNSAKSAFVRGFEGGCGMLLATLLTIGLTAAMCAMVLLS